MFSMPITFGAERSISLPPAFMLTNYHYAVGDDVDVDSRGGYLGNFFGIFTRVLRKVSLLDYRYLLYLGLAIKHDRFPNDILGHEKPVILEPYQNWGALPLTPKTYETSFLFTYLHDLTFHLAGVDRIGDQIGFQLSHGDSAVDGDGFAVLYAGLGRGDFILLGRRCCEETT